MLPPACGTFAEDLGHLRILSYPNIGMADAIRIWPQLAGMAPAIAQQIETDAKYAVYLDRQNADVAAYPDRTEVPLIDPVPHRLGVQLEDPGDVVDREQRVGGVRGRVHGRVTLAPGQPGRRRLETRRPTVQQRRRWSRYARHR